MIDPENETLIPLKAVPNLLPSRVAGKRLNIATVWRWALRSGNPLETIIIGGGRFTSVQAIDRFIGRSNKSSSVPQGLSTCNAKKAGKELRKLIGDNGKAA